jgi:hypothetical protein
MKPLRRTEKDHLRKRMTAKIKRMCGLVALLCALIMLSQCATAHKEAPLPHPALETEKLPDDIERLTDIADKAADPSMRAKADLQLAKLYSSYKNPKPDYQQALKRLEMYLSFDPAKGETDEMKNWLSLLHELAEGSEEIRKATQTLNQLTKDNNQLIKDNRELTKENRELAKENKELKDTVEELKNIDIKMEEKRKQIK